MLHTAPRERQVQAPPDPEQTLEIQAKLSIFACRGRPRSVASSVGAVAADIGACSQVGLAILETGGNAVDAGVVSGSCLLQNELVA